MSARNTVTAVAGVKLAIFTACSLVVTAVLAMIMGNFGFGSTTEYKAVFKSASMISSGDDVRIAGLTVGSVKDVKIYQRNHALVTFSVKSDVPVTKGSRAGVRFLNLVGDRYISLSQGKAGAPPLHHDDVIPMSLTTPALDLTALFNGFQPLFTALDPDQINELSLNLVKVLQGEGGTIQSLLAQTASLTNGLADRDELIGDVITNLSSTLQTVDSHHKELNSLVVELRGWLGNVSKDRKVIGASVQNISSLADDLAGLLVEGRPYLKNDVKQIGRLTKILNSPESTKLINETFARLPDLFRRQTRIGSYGSWYNYYLCDLRVSIKLPGLDTLTDPLTNLGLPDLDKLGLGGLTQPVIDKLNAKLANVNVYSTAKRCD